MYLVLLGKMGKWNTREGVILSIVKVPVNRNNKYELLGSFKEKDEFYEKINKTVSRDMLLKITYVRDIKIHQIERSKNLDTLGLEIQDIEIGVKKDKQKAEKGKNIQL